MGSHTKAGGGAKRSLSLVSPPHHLHLTPNTPTLRSFDQHEARSRDHADQLAAEHGETGLPTPGRGSRSAASRPLPDGRGAHVAHQAGHNQHHREEETHAEPR